MRWLRRLEGRLSRYGVPNVTVVLVALQVLVYLVIELDISPNLRERIQLVPQLVLTGEVWRVFTFLCDPPEMHPIFVFFFWYLFYLMGTALEMNWGALRYNVFLLIGFAATVSVSFLTPEAAATNAFVQGSVFLAFAHLYPDFTLMLFFILPVKSKWLALLTWCGYFLTVVNGTWPMRLAVIASVLNFLIFFGADIVNRVRTGRRRMVVQTRKLTAQVNERPYFHRCVVCGVTDRTNPDMDFRYCTKCVGACGYCRDHLHNHEHITDPAALPKA